jgi:hypothetical protein
MILIRLTYIVCLEYIQVVLSRVLIWTQLRKNYDEFWLKLRATHLPFPVSS